MIASLLVSDDAPFLCAPVCQPADFFRERNAWIYAAELALHARGEPVNQVTVANELHTAGRLDAVGGSGYLARLTTDLPTAVGADYYARIVHRDRVWRDLMAAGQHIAQRGWEGGHDLEGGLVAAERELQALSDGELEAPVRPVAEIIAEREGDWLLELIDASTQRGVPTGLAGVDKNLDGGGLLPGKVYGVGGLPSMGKTTFCTTVAGNITAAGYDVLFFSLEQDGETIARKCTARYLAGDARLAGRSLSEWQAEVRRQQLAAPADVQMALADAAAKAKAATGRLHLDTTPNLSPAGLRLRARKVMRRHPVRVLVIDYLHKLASDREHRHGADDRSPVEKYHDILQSLALIARELDVAILLAFQFNREPVGSDRMADCYRPRLSDGLHSGDIERYCYAVLGLNAPQYHADQGRALPDGYVLKPDLLDVCGLKQQTGKQYWAAPLRYLRAFDAIEDYR